MVPPDYVDPDVDHNILSPSPSTPIIADSPLQEALDPTHHRGFTKTRLRLKVMRMMIMMLNLWEKDIVRKFLL